jgi:myosin heavy subunit
MMSNNATQMYQRQAERSEQEAQSAREMKMAFELKCGKEKQALEVQLQATSGKCDNAKEVAQQLQEDNANLQQKLSDAHDLLAKNSKVNKELLSDKKNLVTTTQQLMRQNSKLKHTLEKETADKTKQAAELVAAKASIAKLSKMELSSAAKKQVKTALKAFPGHHHQHLSEKDKAHMRDMDKYIDSAESEGDELAESQLRAVQQEDELLEKGKVGTHLTDWLGLKASPKPAAAAPESSPTLVKAPAKQKASADDSAESVVASGKKGVEEGDSETPSATAAGDGAVSSTVPVSSPSCNGRRAQVSPGHAKSKDLADSQRLEHDGVRTAEAGVKMRAGQERWHDRMTSSGRVSVGCGLRLFEAPQESAVVAA